MTNRYGFLGRQLEELNSGKIYGDVISVLEEKAAVWGEFPAEAAWMRFLIIYEILWNELNGYEIEVEGQ